MTEEEAFHRQVALYLDAVVLPPAWWTTFPSGSGGAARGGQLKAKGLKAGVPDLMLIHEGRVYFIELKTAKGRLNAAQKVCIPEIILAGALVHIARSIADVRVGLVLFGIPHRGPATLGAYGAAR